MANLALPPPPNTTSSTKAKNELFNEEFLNFVADQNTESAMVAVNQIYDNIVQLMELLSHETTISSNFDGLDNGTEEVCKKGIPVIITILQEMDIEHFRSFVLCAIIRETYETWDQILKSDTIEQMHEATETVISSFISTCEVVDDSITDAVKILALKGETREQVADLVKDSIRHSIRYIFFARHTYIEQGADGRKKIKMTRNYMPEIKIGKLYRRVVKRSEIPVV